MAGEARTVALLLLLAAHADASGRDRGESPARPSSRGLNRIAGTVVNGVLEGLDVDAIVERVDIERVSDRIVARIDVDGIVARIDPDDIVARTDLDALVAQVDIDRLLEQVDVNRLLEQVDVNRLLDRVDVDRLLERADIEGIVRRAGIPEMVAESTSQVAGSTVDLVRQQAVSLDVLLTRSLLGLLRRDVATLASGPPKLVGDDTGMVGTSPSGRGRSGGHYSVSGHYAGILTRVASLAGDGAAVAASWTALSAGFAYLLGIFGLDISSQPRGPLFVAGLIVYGFLWWWLSIAVAGRTPAMLLLGLRVVDRQGDAVRQRRALIRTFALPLSVIPFGLGMLGVLFDREHRALHDMIAGSVVVYDWGDATARISSPLGRFLAERGDDGISQGFAPHPPHR